MKPESSEFDSIYSTELTSAQKAALESVLFGNAASSQGTPPPQPQQRPQQPFNFDEPQVFTIDMTRKQNPSARQQSDPRVRVPQYREPRQREPQYREPQQRAPQYREPQSRNPQAPYRAKRRKKPSLQSRIKKLLMILIPVIILGFWVRFMIEPDPPSAEILSKTILIGETVVPGDFVRNVTGASEIVSIEFVDQPDVYAHQSQRVEIIITDENGKSSTFESTLTIQLNQSPPVIEGTDTIISTLGNPIMYRHGVSAKDDFGRELELHVDSDNVNQNEVGVYSIRFWAVDLTGIMSEIFEEVHIVDADVVYIHERVDSILDEILTAGMSQLEKVSAIHQWVRVNISYAAVIGGPDTVYENAYRALRDRQGDCYVYYAISELLLTRAGIPNMPIERIPGTPTRHRWSLVNPDDLGWHHFDATVTRLQLGAKTAFFTDSQARDFTRQFVEFNGTRDFYTFNPELYPDIVQ